jgi:hypothetical protein
MTRALTALAVVLLAALPAAAAPKKKKDAVSDEAKLAQRIQRVRTRLAEVTTDDASAKTLARSAVVYLDRAGEALAAKKGDTAAGLTSAADALTRAVDHIRHYRDPRKVDFPPREEQARHMERAYLRLRQADYFQAQSKDPQSKSLLGMARQFYQRARSSYDGQEDRGADEYTKVSEEIVNALEHLAHTATPSPSPPRLR